MQEVVFSDSNAWLTTRAFTHPDHTDRDFAAMTAIIHEVAALACKPIFLQLQDFPTTVYRQRKGLSHRFVINNHEPLCTYRKLTLVGFFGIRHTQMDIEVLTRADDLLVTEFRIHDGILAYVSYQLNQEQYGNVVIFDSPTAQLHWSESLHHAHAARDLAPTYYRHIRLHNGFVHDGIQNNPRIELTSTKYFDYCDIPNPLDPWRGIRHYGQAADTANGTSRA